jgi:beta-mannosidase
MLADRSAVLTLTMADTIISVWVNGKQVGSCDNQFRRWRFDVSEALTIGENSIKLVFTSAESHALALAEKLPYPIPYSVYPSIGTLFEKPSATAAGIGVHAS